MERRWYAGVKCYMKSELLNSREEEAGHEMLWGGSGEGAGEGT